jgi:hypothetical protein
MGSLKLYKTSYIEEGYELLWSTTGNKGQTWSRQYIQVSSNQPFKVNFNSILKLK